MDCNVHISFGQNLKKKSTTKYNNQIYEINCVYSLGFIVNLNYMWNIFVINIQ